jgi:hypothetical protein
VPGVRLGVAKGSIVLNRGWLLRFVAVSCLLVGVIVLYTRWDAQRVSQAQTPQVAAMLGLIMLPGATLAARRMERRARRYTA